MLRMSFEIGKQKRGCKNYIKLYVDKNGGKTNDTEGTYGNSQNIRNV